jgi:hypothetical protein
MRTPTAFALVPLPLLQLQPSRLESIDDWPWLQHDVLCFSRSRQVCMTCHFLCHHCGSDAIPLLACHLHHGRIAHGERSLGLRGITASSTTDQQAVGEVQHPIGQGGERPHLGQRLGRRLVGDWSATTTVSGESSCHDA